MCDGMIFVSFGFVVSGCCASACLYILCTKQARRKRWNEPYVLASLVFVEKERLLLRNDIILFDPNMRQIAGGMIE